MFHRRSAVAPALALGAALALAAPDPARAQTKPGTEPTFPEQAEAFVLDALKRALEFASSLGNVVPYEMPEQLPNGDIIIRRKPAAPPQGPLPELPPAGPPGTTQL
ncbi:hypothetical protein [Azospirillum sp. SYSU D00513]|uniref:hypothetical protein n=1 Tax=Azospirillum sp. SYSU D00513 TaxID=2812561 RepID=UPI001A978175|nr:hypothetical protein [Azospirillum sp. SYSU D00513]